MERHQLEHLIRAASGIADAREIIVVGSQAILGTYPDAPPSLLVSIEADLYPRYSPQAADLIDGSIGENSPSHESFGYYAHGVGPGTAVLPEGWEDRLVRIENENTGTGVALCLEAHDLAVSKLVAGRQKDLDFVGILLKERLANPATVAERLAHTPLDDTRRQLAEQKLRRLRK